MAAPTNARRVDVLQGGAAGAGATCVGVGGSAGGAVARGGAEAVAAGWVARLAGGGCGLEVGEGVAARAGELGGGAVEAV
jgi:hypothetical protein